MAARVMGMDESESRAWIALVSLAQALTPALDTRLRPLGLTAFELGALVTLSNAPGRSLRISRLAELTHAPLPRMSKVVARLEAKALVRRSACQADARATSLELTTDGQHAILAALPTYTDEARALVLSKLRPDQITMLADILEPIALELDPNGPVARGRSGQCGVSHSD
ncbi:DNA-binding transcriptional regulator, MarR family [Sanguibacter gelidistatuariae]|uniref:DNA-binding transcriptional regulator, MarR family n=1 Tax=Sanguibacter gelidistatuariae TaxID=1814289 RepID=A0A1G6L3F4_9MICO|nr:MarR family transcriptional regulator [Sanguibacter gelidistatuariae]SDC37255.1 DNA-binding transcriptional regulator, MarR family [Sanguibacter gelidistatuariae]